MTTLVLALYAEGHADERFLPVVIQRAVEQILQQRGRTVVDVMEPITVNHTIDRQFATRPERILEAARRSAGYHALVVHADADYPTSARALNERFGPGLERVSQARYNRQAVCDHLLPIIPVQMTEAWMLADPEALRTVVGTATQALELGLPAHAHEVESDPYPKQTLEQAIRKALASRPKRRRRIDLNTVYEPLARQISLERLAAVPSYRQFVADMIGVLIALHLAS
ncbi:MAG: DUF4276 family protein [Chloroflexi bacterium]|nr:DUF4276 family protein [Chloroflexota bacterium]